MSPAARDWPKVFATRSSAASHQGRSTPSYSGRPKSDVANERIAPTVAADAAMSHGTKANCAAAMYGIAMAIAV